MAYSKHIISKIVEDINNHSQENLYLYDLKNIDYDTSLIVQKEIHAYVKNENISQLLGQRYNVRNVNLAQEVADNISLILINGVEDSLKSDERQNLEDFINN